LITKNDQRSLSTMMTRFFIALLFPLAATAIEPSKCVTIKYYSDPDCKTDVRRESTFSTYAVPGESPCITDSSGHMKGISINDMYCTDDSYHMSVYRSSETCEGNSDVWVLKADTCRSSAMFASCIDGPCPEGAKGEPPSVADIYEMTSQVA
jgi:hypothetical protein